MPNSELKHYWVLTPEFDVSAIDGYAVRDVVAVFALNRRHGRILALREFRKQRSQWVQDCRSDGQCPLAGLKVEDY